MKILFMGTPDFAAEALKALYSSNGSVALVNDMPIQVTYEESYPADLEKAITEAKNHAAV